MKMGGRAAASVPSISTISTNGNKDHILGFVSGVDTDSVIESLPLGIQTRVDKQTSPKQRLEWRQETHRDLITKISTFGGQYFFYYGSSQANLLSTSLFKTIAGISSSSTIKISPVSSNVVSSMGVGAVKQLVTTCSVRTAGTVTGESRRDGVDFINLVDAIEETKSLSVTLGGVSRTISFTIEGKLSDPADPNPSEEADKERTPKNINQVLYRNFGTSVGMKFEEGPPNSKRGTMELAQLNVNGVVINNAVNSSRRVIIEITGDSDSLSTIANSGFKGRFSNRLDCGTSLKNMSFSTSLQRNQFEFDINGVAIRGLNGDSTLSDMISAISSSDAGVKVFYLPASDKFVMKSSSTGEISNIEMGQRYGNLLTTVFGAEVTGLRSSTFSKPIEETGHTDSSSVTNKLNSEGDQSLVLQVDGQDFTAKSEGKTGSKNYKDEEGLINTINPRLNKESGYGEIAFSWDNTNKQVTLKSSEHKVGFTDANLTTGIASDLGFSEKDSVYDGSTELSSLGITGDIKVGNITYHLGDPSAKTVSDLAGIMGGTYVDRRIDIPSQTGGSTVSGNVVISGTNLAKNLSGRENVELTPVFNTLASNSVPNPTILKGTLELTVSSGNTITINAGSLASSFDGLVTTIRAETGGNVIYAADGRLQTSGTTGEFTTKGTDDSERGLLNQLFSQGTIAFNPRMTASVTSGQNAVLIVGGTDIERNANTFELDGITMELTFTYDTSNPLISLTMFRDTDKVIDSLKNFVDNYNALIGGLNKQPTETANYKKYAPSTDTQKKEMSDKEVKLWGERSKQGPLHSGSDISSFLSEMRTVLYGNMGGAELSFHDIGVETSDNWRDSGKPVIDKDVLKSAVAIDPDAVSKLFTDRDQELGIKVWSAIKAAVNVSNNNPGSIMRYAGTKDVFLTSNTLYEEMKHISETLSNLSTKYELKKTRYWKQFTVTEQAISNVNSQSSWLTQQFSS